MNNLIRRSLTGILYVLIIVLTVTLSNVTFMLLQAVLIVFGILEFNRLSAMKEPSALIAWVDVLGGLLLLLSIDIFGSALPGIYAMALYGTYIIVRLIIELYRGYDRPISSLGHSMLGQLYVALPVSLMSMVYSYGGAPLVLAMFIMIWLNDTGAFCVGSLCGRHKLFERVSPKKTWEGFFGGLLFAVACAPVFKYGFGDYYLQPLGWYIGAGLLVGIVGTWGDLVESMMKRAIHVKDSGNLLPGHGGILDRIDSLLLVAPAMALYIMLTQMACEGLFSKMADLLL